MNTDETRIIEFRSVFHPCSSVAEFRLQLMKPTACQALRSSLAAGRPVFGLWLALVPPAVTEMAVALGLDFVVIDAEHGHLDWKDIAEHIRATIRSNTVALVRLAELNVG